jgi:hypothetical protein
MISNGQRSGNRNDIAAEPMDGFSSLRCDRSKRGTNAAIRPPGPIRILLSRDTTRGTAMTPSALQTASPAMASVDARVPLPSCPELIPCPARWWTLTKPYLPWHSPRGQALGRWNGRRWPTFFGRGTAMTGSLYRSPLAGRPTPQVRLRECDCVVPFVPRRYLRRKSVRPHQGSRNGRAKRLPQGTQKRAQL